MAAGAAAALVVAALRRKPARTAEEQPQVDLGFMRALHEALRRDARRLETIAPRLKDATRMPATVEAGWHEFRDELVRHHEAEDDDLWPVLRAHLRDVSDLRDV